ncbi:MAG: putative regulatory protein, partial [Conexibacter sp.]|nr:putative regulatory protein [Conexibacter sp.]
AAVARSVAARLAALGEQPAALACAVAVLGHPAEVRAAAAVAAVDAAAATLYADALADAGLLGPGRPLDFVHPLVATAVRDGIPTGRRALLHARAFELLASEGADVLRAATHLLHTEPDGRAQTIDVLRRAARAASLGGDPATAVALQQRALREGPTGVLEADLLEELGRAQLASGDAAGIATLERARPRHEDPRRRAAIDLTLGISNYERGEIGAARANLTRGLTEPLDAEDELRISLQAADMTVARSLAGGPSVDAEALAPLLERRERGRTPVERLVLAQIAFHALQAAELPHAGTVAIARRALPPRGQERLDAYDALALPLAGMALYFSDAYELAEEAFGAEIERARVQGARLAFATASFFRGVPRFLRGRFLAAIDDWQGALDAIEDGWAFALPSARALRALVALERDDPDTAAAMLELPGGDDQWAEHPTFPYVIAVRGFQASLGERPQEALALLLRAGDALDAQGARNPAIMHWQTEAALVSLALGEQDQARRLSRDLQRRAQRFGAARTLGIAQRTIGQTHGGAFGREQLTRSVRTLEGSGADFELALSLVELGAERRRQGQRTEARDLLRRALDLADRCGALRLRRRAAEELHVAGGRPRRTRTTGVEGLTSSERRVAQLAAEGSTNRQIAQRLFVTLRTVETHLTHTYAKLGIGSRAELAQALERAADRS